jgi:hypothetical protein
MNGTTRGLGAAFLGIVLALVMLASALAAGSLMRGQGQSVGGDLWSGVFVAGRQGTCPLCGGRGT